MKTSTLLSLVVGTSVVVGCTMDVYGPTWKTPQPWVNPLTVLVKDGRLAELASEAKRHPELLNYEGAGVVLPLVQAAELKYDKAAAILLDHGANANGTHAGGRPLVRAILNCDLNMAQLLMASGATFQAAFPDGHSPLKPALLRATRIDDRADATCLELIRFLLANGAIVEDGYGSESSPLLSAVAGGFAEIASALLLAGADPNRITSHVVAPLQLAVIREDLRMADLLLAKGANPNGFKPGTTPPIRAAKSEEMRNLLLRYGAHE